MEVSVWACSFLLNDNVEYTLSRPAGRFKILGGQPKNLCNLVNLYPIFKILFSSESCSKGKLLGGKLPPPASTVPAALNLICKDDFSCQTQ